MFPRPLVALAICITALASLPVAAASAADGEGEASFDGETIVLDDGSWDGARACAVVADGVQCFATEAEMNAWLAGGAGAAGAAAEGQTVQRAVFAQAATMALSCSSTLRLYEHGGFSGRTLFFSSRAQWFNLSLYGFANRTSSFRVGACSSYMADYNNGGGGWYPGGGAFASVSVISGSWNDRINSIYLV
jgi:hypothetical protein